MRSGSHVVIRLIGFFLAIGTLASAQVATTSLRGTVYDPNGAVLAQAAVTMASRATGFSRSTKTDGQGVYEFLQIPLGTYDVTATAQGFATVKVASRQVLLSASTTQDFALTVPTALTSVDIQSKAHTTDIDGAWISDHILILDDDFRSDRNFSPAAPQSCSHGSHVYGHCQVTLRNGLWVQTGDCIANCNSVCVDAYVAPCKYGAPARFGTNFCQATLYVDFTTSCSFVY